MPCYRRNKHVMNLVNVCGQPFAVRLRGSVYRHARAEFQSKIPWLKLNFTSSNLDYLICMLRFSTAVQSQDNPRRSKTKCGMVHISIWDVGLCDEPCSTCSRVHQRVPACYAEHSWKSSARGDQNRALGAMPRLKRVAALMIHVCKQNSIVHMFKLEHDRSINIAELYIFHGCN